MEYIIECEKITDRNSLHELLASKLSFPDWYGRNLDALYDQLTSIHQHTHLILKNWEHLPDTLKTIHVVLDHAEEENDNLIITYC